MPEPTVDPLRPLQDDSLVGTADFRSLASSIAESTTPRAGFDNLLNRGRFTILGEHAEGGLGRVSKARDEKLQRTVALKEIRPDRRGSAQLRERFLHEAAITGRLEHPGIVLVYALDEGPDGEPFYAMRFIQGRTLGDAIREFHLSGGRQPPEPIREQSQGADAPRSGAPDFTSLQFRELLQRFISVCNTIAYAHSQRVIHRDLKPANVMLGDYGETLVVDWGLAKVIGAAGTMAPTQSDQRQPASAEQSTALGSATDELAATKVEPLGVPASSPVMTQPGQVLGTPVYMAPEQARGDQLGPPADIYALGAILYELLTGRHPYDGLAMKAIFDALKAGTPPVAPHTVQPRTPKALEAICRKAMSAAPDDRYATPTQLAKDIEHWLADEPVTCYGEPWPVRAGRWSRKHRTLVMSGVVGLGGAIVLLVVSLILVDQNRRQIAFEKEQTEQQRIAAVAARDRGSQIVEDVFGDESFESLRRQPGGADTRPEALRVERAALLPGVHHRFTTG